MNKITILSSFPPIKGITPYTTELLKELDKKVKIQFIGFKDIYPEFVYPWWTKDNNLTIPVLNNTTLWNKITWYNPISWIIAWFKVSWDIIHAQWWSWILAPIYIIILWIAKLRWIKVVLTIHNVSPHEKSFIKTFMNNIVYKLSNKYIVHSIANKVELQKIVWNKKEIEVIAHWIIAPKFKAETKKNLRIKYKLENNEKIILFYWNIRDYKWLNIMLESYSNIIKSWEKDFKLIIAWPCWQDWEKYQEIIDKENLTEHILRIDWFISEQETWELFTLSDLLILPYKDFDSQSWVIATNLHFNLPVIVSDLWWLTAVIKDKDLIFEVWNTEELKTKILNLFKWNNLELKKEYLKSIKKDFEWGSIVEKTLEFYEK